MNPQSDAGKRPRRPIMALLELLSRRWTLRVLWELRDGPLSSRALREATGISPTVLQTRIDELRAGGIVELQSGSGYRMTPLGVELTAAFAPLYAFANRWAERQSDHATAFPQNRS